MPTYPFCVIDDVQKYNPHRSTYSASTKPTSTQVNEFMDEIAAQLVAVSSDAGYDTDNFTDYSQVALAITAGDDVAVAVTTGDGSQFSTGDRVMIAGLSSAAARQKEYAIVKSVSTDTVTLDTVDSNYAASSVYLYLVSRAWDTLRKLNAIGAAAMAEQSAHMGVAPNESDHAEKLWAQYYGSEETMDGLWAIANIEGYLVGATVTGAAVEKAYMKSYGSENSTDADVEPRFEIDTDF